MDNDISNNTTKGNEPPTDADALIKEMQKRVNASGKKWEGQFREMRRLRKFIAGDDKPAGSVYYEFMDEPSNGPSTHMANIVYATLQGLLPLLYAKDPEVAVKPTTQVDPNTESYTVSSKFAQTLELILNRSFLESGLKQAAKAAITEAQINSVAVTKTSYQSDYYRDPIILNRIDDLQQKLAQARARGQELESEKLEADEYEIQAQLMQNEVEALQQQIDIPQAEGLVIDLIPIDDFRLDPHVDTLRQYRQGSWMAQRTWMTPEQVRTTFAADDDAIDDIRRYQRNDDGIPKNMDEGEYATPGDAVEHKGVVLPIWELWDKTTSSVYTWGEGGKKWLRDPWQPERLGQRWYPFFLLAFNWLDASHEWPISDVALLENLGREYDEIRRQAFEHRKLCAPHYLGDRSKIADRSDVETFAVAGLGDVALIDAGGVPVNEVFQPAVPPPYNPNVYDTTQIRTDVEWTSGLGDAQRGGVLRSKTATEANIQQSGLTARMDEKRDQLEDWLTDMAKYASEILIMSMSLLRAQRIAGPAAFWPQVDRETLYTMVEVEIKAGSTGKPNKERDLELWISLLPELKEYAQFIMQQRAQGVPDEENIWVQIMIETLRRADENIDIEKFLPGEPVATEAQPGTGQVGPQGATPDELAAQGAPQGQSNGAGEMSPEEMQMAQQQQMAQMEAEQAQAKMQMEQQQRQFSMELEAREMEGKEALTKQQLEHRERKMQLEEAQGGEAIAAARRKAIDNTVSESRRAQIEAAKARAQIEQQRTRGK